MNDWRAVKIYGLSTSRKSLRVSMRGSMVFARSVVVLMDGDI